LPRFQDGLVLLHSASHFIVVDAIHNLFLIISPRYSKLMPYVSHMCDSIMRDWNWLVTALFSFHCWRRIRKFLIFMTLLIHVLFGSLQNTKMHRSLSIPEVIRLVMEYLHPYPVNQDITRKMSRVRKATLLNAALTCSSFSGPSLDVLWHCMDDLLPLFILLPNFEFSLNEDMVRREYNIRVILKCLQSDSQVIYGEEF